MKTVSLLERLVEIQKRAASPAAAEEDERPRLKRRDQRSPRAKARNAAQRRALALGTDIRQAAGPALGQAGADHDKQRNNGTRSPADRLLELDGRGLHREPIENHRALLAKLLKGQAS